MTTPQIELYIMDTGFCIATENHMIQGGSHRKIECHSLVALIKHPAHGFILWDTGYAPHMLSETRRFPYSLYRLATPLHIQPEQSAAAQLIDLGIHPKEIKTIVISHFHADHIAGLRDFPNAQFLVDEKAYQDVATRTNLRALQRAFIPALLPIDFKHRLTPIKSFSDATLPGLGASFDMFQDGSISLFPLPGHARGQMGMFAHTTRGPVLFAADAAWMIRSIRQCKPPSRLTNFIVDDPKQLSQTLLTLHNFWRANPDIRIIPTHCPEAFLWSKTEPDPGFKRP